MGKILYDMKEASKAASEITECPNKEGDCNYDLITYGERMMWCPVFRTVNDINETGKCKYASKLADKFRYNVKSGLAKYSGVPKRHIEKFDDMHESDALREALMYDYRDFLVLCGPVGTGKSFIAAYLCYRWALDSYGGYFKNEAEWGEVAARLREQVGWYTAYEVAAATCQDQWDIASKYRVLVIDDLGIEDNTPRSIAAINFMVSKRYDHGEDMATIITGNMTTDDITGRYGKRLTDRLIENGRIIVCDGPAVRRKVKWRTLEGLPVTPDYAEAKLGLKHGGGENNE